MKIGNYAWKKERFSAFLTSTFAHLERNADDWPPFFLPPPLLNKHMRKHLTPEERQLVLDYGLQNLQKGPDGGDEIDGRLILVRGTVKFLVVWFKVDKTTIQRIWNRVLKSYWNDDTYVFASLSRKLLINSILESLEDLKLVSIYLFRC